MKPRVSTAISKLFDDAAWEGTKDDVAAIVHCEPKTAWRHLCNMWMHNLIYIKRWNRQHGAPQPVYALRNERQEDAPRIKPLTGKEQVHRRDPEKHKFNQRLYRFRKKVQSGEVRLGIWGV